MIMGPGARVQVRNTYHWAKGAQGIIALPPEYLRALAPEETPWESWQRQVKTMSGERVFCWVEFVIPQYDKDGNGPYAGAEIPLDMLELIR